MIAHAVHLDDAELDCMLDHDVAVVSCPWAYLRLGQGVTRSFPHPRLIRHGGRVALGCDSENAGDAIDVLLAARLFAGLAKDTTGDPDPLLRQGGAGAGDDRRGAGDRSRPRDRFAGGRQAGRCRAGRHLRPDVDAARRRPRHWRWCGPATVAPYATWSAAGKIVVRGGRCVTVDQRHLAAESSEAHQRLVSRCRANPRDQ